MKKLLLVLVLMIFVSGTVKCQTWGKDSTKAGDSTLILTPKGLYNIASFTIKGTANTDSLKIYHSMDRTNWSIISARTLAKYGTDDTVIVNKGAGTIPVNYLVMFPTPYYIMIRLANAVYLSTRRVDIEYYYRENN